MLLQWPRHLAGMTIFHTAMGWCRKRKDWPILDMLADKIDPSQRVRLSISITCRHSHEEQQSEGLTLLFLGA